MKYTTDKLQINIPNLECVFIHSTVLNLKSNFYRCYIKRKSSISAIKNEKFSFLLLQYWEKKIVRWCVKIGTITGNIKNKHEIYKLVSNLELQQIIKND